MSTRDVKVQITAWCGHRKCLHTTSIIVPYAPSSLQADVRRAFEAKGWQIMNRGGEWYAFCPEHIGELGE